MNARLVDGDVVREGEQVVLGDTRTDAGSALFGPEVRYEMQCRRHWLRCETRPAARRGANA